jgi:hypothetical protein
VWPLQSLRGKTLSYWAHDDDGVWVINCSNNLLPNYQFETGPYEQYESVTDQKLPANPYREDRAWLLEIGKNV